MAHVLVRDLPDAVHQELVRRAERAGQSLQQYLTAQLTRLATTPSVADVLDDIERESGGRVGLSQAVEDVYEERARR